MESSDFDPNAAWQVIETQCQGLRLESVTLLSEDGQFNRLLLANGEYVFRFPRYRAGVRVLEREAQILRHISDRMPLKTPRVRWVSPMSAEPGEAFLSYDYLPGSSLWSEVLESEVHAVTRVKLASQLGGFLAKLHEFELWDEAREWPVLDGPNVWSQMYEEFQECLFPSMRPDAKLAVEAHFTEYLQEPALREFTPCLRHGDFGAGNVLYHASDQTISGIVDFSEAGIGDPAVDLAAASCFGEEMYAGICAAYPAADALLARARFYRGTFALQEALHGLRVGDVEAYESGMESYV